MHIITHTASTRRSALSKSLSALRSPNDCLSSTIHGRSTLSTSIKASSTAPSVNQDGTPSTILNTKIKPSLDWEQTLPHPGYDLAKIEDLHQTHHEPTEPHDRVALFAVKLVRSGFDVLSGYRGPGGGMTERDWLNRCVFLETVAGVPGMVAGMARHLRSLRGMRRDYGWIHTLLEEAENERMHLMIFVQMRRPSWLVRLGVLGAQGVFFNVFFLTYLVSPKSCHRFVGYLEEEAVKTYTGLLADIEDGHLPAWQSEPPPRIARMYYNLPDSASVADLIKCVRADEANHRDVNHGLADLQHNDVNPFAVDAPITDTSASGYPKTHMN